MTRRIGLALALCVLVVLALAASRVIQPADASAVASAKDDGACTYDGMAGRWGSTLTGTVMPPTGGAVPMATVAITTFDADGTFTGTQTASMGGTVSEEVLMGTWTVNPDCTGTITVNILDASGQMTRTAVWATVTVDNQTEIRAIIKSLVRGGTSVPAVVTMNAKKLSPDRGRGYEGKG